jgi:methylenetetrahydrofolate reductase (NADPH)
MKIGQAVQEKGKSLSLEFFPPKDQSGEEQLFETIAKLEALNPTFVSVTYGAGGSTLKNTRHVVLRIQRETHLVAMPHLTCVDQSRDELKNILEDYKGLGIENVLALRGDPPKDMERFVPPKDGFCYAKDLVALAASLSAFSIGVAVYPEGHIESPNLEMDMYYTKQKIDAGADFAITQMFFDNRFFYSFLERAAKAGIRIPIIPGIMPIMNISKIEQFSRQCGAKLPVHLVQKLDKVRSSDQAARKVGIEIATEQCADLLKNGVNYFHFYTLNRSEAVIEIVNNLGLKDLGGKGSIKMQI